jgi:hypothetical protein
MAILSDHGLRLNRRSFKSLRELERIRARELTEQFLRGSNDIIRRSSVQLQRNVNAMPLQHSRGDKTDIERIIAGVQGWETALRRVFAGASEDAKSS